MKRGKTLTELAQEIERQQTAKHDLLALTSAIRMVPPDDVQQRGHLALRIGDGAEFKINDLAHDQIGAFTSIPGKYYDKMKAEMPALLAANVNAWMNNELQTRLVRTMDGTARAFLSDAYRPLENYDLAEAVLPVLSDLKLELVSSEITERRLYIKAVDARINRDVPNGHRMGDGSHTFFDTCSPAIVISNSEVGYGMLSIETAVWRKVCTNLAVFSDESMKRRHVGARHDIAAGENVAALLSDDTKRATDKALWLQVRDVVKGSFEEARFNARMDKIEGMTSQKISGDPVKVVDFTAKRFGLTETEGKSVLRHLIEGGDLSRYGVWNAVTRTAEDVESYDRASEIERMGGHIVTLANSEWKELAAAA